MYQRFRTYAKRIIHAFSTRTRVLGTLIFLVISGWLVSQFVLAQKEMNVYIFPSAVFADGWQNETQALSQDLSPDATLPDFTSENSARVLFGLPAQEPVSSTTNEVAPVSAPESNSEVPAQEIPSGVPSIVSGLLPLGNDGTAESVPSVGEATTTPSISFPNPFIPTNTTPLDIASSSLQSKRTTPNTIANFFGVKEALAIEDSSTTTAPDTASTTTVDGGEAATPTPMSDDPYTIASCTTLGLECHLISFVGFGLGDTLTAHPLTSATLELSLAGRGDGGGEIHDRVLVRVYHNGRWEYLGETEVKGEFGNAKRGGYLSYDLPSLLEWKDLADLKVVVEYSREGKGNASAYLDGIWINAKYNTDSVEEGTPEEMALSQMNVRSSLAQKDAEERRARRDILDAPEGGTINLSHADLHEDAQILIRTDKEVYRTLGNTSAYLNVTNQSDKEQSVRLQFHFPSQGGGVAGLARLSRSVPYKVSNLKYDAVGYFCAAGWETNASSSRQYLCAETSEVRSCGTLNDDKTNCIVDGARVGLSQDIEYRDGWLPLVLAQGSFRDAANIFAKAIDFILGQLPKDVIPESEQPIAYTQDVITLLPGQTIYLRADLSLPLNGRGDFYIEGAAVSGEYGLVHASWDGSWNYRTAFDIENDNINVEGSFVLPVSLDSLPTEFWDRVNSDGSDIRFVDETGTVELPYWLASWKHKEEKGFAWVRVPKMSGTSTTRIYVYYGDSSASSHSSPVAPFRTDTPTPRAVVVGSSQHDMTLLVIALGEDTHVEVGGNDMVTLKKGESALFDNLAPGMTINADGPLSLALESSDQRAMVVPYGFAGANFVLPAIGNSRPLSLAALDDDSPHAELRRSGVTTTSIDPILGTIVSENIELSSSVSISSSGDILALLGADEAKPIAPVYPSTDEPLYGFAIGKTTIGFGADGSTMKAVCASGGVQTVDGRREGMSTVLNHCQDSAFPALADSIRVSEMANPAAVVSVGTDVLSSFIPKSEFASQYTLSRDAKMITLLCAPEDDAFAVGVFDSQGTLTSSTTCAGYGARPGKAILEQADGFAIGSVIRSLDASSTSFMAAYQPLGHSLVSADAAPLVMLFGAPLLRPHSPNHPRITTGEEEFVIPAEHRKLDVDQNGKERVHVDKLLTAKREFSVHEQPGFQFQYKPQSNSFIQSVREAFGVAPFSVTRVTLKHPLFGESDAEYDIGYGDNDTWSLTLKNTKEHLHPGKYTLHVEIEEGGDTYIDEYDFYWGVIAINYNKSVFTPGEEANISIGALSDNGDTICDAQLKLWITPPAGSEAEISVASSGVCNGNNVVDVPDYRAVYTFPSENATGTYQVKLVRFDSEGNIASQVTDTILVEETIPVIIEREGPTRIYPVAHYPMKLKVTATADFKGNIVERLPGDFILIDRGGADLQWGDDEHSFITASWPVDMKKGATISFSYTFDAPDRSPYLYLLGPAKIEGDITWSEARQWQIASDAVGQVYIYWDQTFIPSGWNCVSCVAGSSTQPFYRQFIQGSSTYNGLGGGNATDTPSASSSVAAIDGTQGSGPVTTTNTINSPIGHSHAFTPTISGSSNLPPYRNLVVLQSQSAGDPVSLPSGAIVAFDVASSSLPSGWNRYTPLDGRYPRGEATSTVGTTGGSATSTHTVSGTLIAPTETGLRSNGASGLFAATQAHTHTLSATNTSVMNTEPPYVELLFAKLNATSAPPTNMIAMWDNTPSSGWVTLSNTGGTLSGKFTKASTTYGGTGGAVFHTFPDIIGATTSQASASSVYAVNAAKGQAPATSTHSVDITSFSTDDTRPPYIDMIFAKRLVGIPFWTQADYRFYANQNANTVTDPWPTGASDLDEDTPIDSATTLAKPGDIVRLRMNLLVANATASPATAFKMQYVAGTDCVNALNWNDVAPIGSTTAEWRGYNNAGVADGALLAATTLTTSNVAESYVETNNSPTNPATSTIGQYAEWDWVLQNNLASAATNYCFRMVKSDGTLLDAYTNYPQILTNTQPNQSSQSAPFNNQKVDTTLPDFNFVSSDNEADDLDYQIQIDTTTAFASPVIDKDSTVNPELFDNIIDPTNKAPFNSGDTIHFKATSALTNGGTYWWRVRTKDSNGSNTWGAWSASYSFTIDTSVAIATWHQTTSAQFQTDSFSGANSSSSNAVMLNSGSTTGTVWSSQIDFSIAATGTVWGSFKVASTAPPGAIVMHVEYLTSTSSWALIPDADLAGNSSGFTSTSTSLLTVNPDTYPSLRLRADLTGASTPVLLDWSVVWGIKVNAPTLYLPFDNQKVATRTPTFEFLTTDPNGNNINYEISWSTTSTFTSSTTVNSATTSSVFVDMTNGAFSNPFPSGHRISFTIPSYLALSSSTPYYWRVRARDPTGSNVYSFWSNTYSVTVDTTITVSTWFQTGGGQFNSDTLTGMTTFATDTAYVSTTTLEALIGYGEGTVQTPRYRIWDGTAWGSELSAQSIGSQINWLVAKASPVTGEYLMGTLGTNNKVNAQVYNGSSWGSLQQINSVSVSNAKARGFDIAYETLTGRAMVVSCNGGVNPVYRIWNSTTSSWSSASTISVTGNNNCQWVKLASNPVSNEIIMLERDTGSRYFGMVWNGSTWVANSTTTLGSITSTANEGMGIDWNASGTRAYAVTSNGANNNFAWKFWSSTSSSWSATATVAITSRLQWAEVQRDPFNNNNLVACYSDLTAPDIGVSRWTGSAWSANTNLVTTANGASAKDVSCGFETNASTTVLRRILVPYSNTAGAQYREWNGNATWYPQAVVSNIGRSATVQTKRTMDGKFLTLFFEHLAQRYQFSYWNGSSWSASTTLETSPSVTAAPFLEPFMIAPKNPGTQGTVLSSAINFSDGNAPAWDQVSWSRTLTGSSTFLVQVQYQTASGTWALIPDADLAGNSTGTSTSPISIRNIDTNTYSVIRLVGNATCVLGNCPTLNDWTVTWAAGINVSGTAKQHDLTTNVTSGTVAVAVNGVLQSGKTGTISGGLWTISNVTLFPGNTVEVFVQGAATSNRAVAVSVYDGPGDFGGLSLNEHWLTLGSASSTQSSTTLTHLSKYDNSVAASSTDIFFDVTPGGDLTMCALALSGGCYDAGIYVPQGNIFQPGTTSAKTITTYDFRIAGGVYMNANSIKVGGSWRNLGGFTPGTGTVTFNSTSTNATIDSTGAATSTFKHVTFGESGNTGTWYFTTPFTATGTVSMNFGTVTPGVQPMTFQGDLTIGASGTFIKGTATTTFSGTLGNTWTDNTAAKQDLGNISINGTTKTITLGSSVRATNIQVASGNTLNAGGANTITVIGFWDNAGTFTPQTGTVAFIATSTSKTINQNTSSFYNVTFSGVGGAWRWLNTNATATNNVTIATGTVTLPGGTFDVGGSFANTGGTFLNNSGVVKFIATAGGKTIQTGTSTFNDLTFSGSGGAWSFVDTNATTSGTLTILAGIPTFPSGVFEVGNNFINTSGSFVANGGTLKLTSSLNSRTVTLGGSSLANFTVQNGGVFTMTDANGTVTGDVNFVAGTTTLPTGTFTIGGSFANTGRFVAGSGTTTFTAASGGKTISTGASSFANVSITGAGTFTVSGNATTTNNFFLAATVGGFTQSSGTTLAVGGIFSNLVGGAATTWTGSILSLTSGTSYTINTKTQGGDLYGTFRVAAGMQLRSWNSSSTIYQIDPTGGLYSQNHNSVSGEVDIFGAYSRTSGGDYWDYATDFDGTALGGSSRQAVVKFASGATASFGAGTTLEIIGAASASTSVDRQGSGNYGVTLSGATINAQYYQFRNMNTEGLTLATSTAITSLANGDFSVDVNGGTGMTISSSTISANAGLQIFNVRFATSSGISSAFNVTTTGTATSFIRFKQHSGNIAGEAFDSDSGPSGGNPGYLRWDDSNFVITISGIVYADAGATPLGGPTCDGVTNVVRVKVAGQGNYAASCSATSSYYAVTGVTFTGDTVMTVYLDTNGGAQGAVVTKSASADLSGIHIYQHRVILRHEDVSAMTIADTNAYDKGDDSDIPFTTATSSVPYTLTTDPETQLWVWNAKTFVPGGNLTLNSGGSGANYDGTLVIDNSAVFTAQGTETHTLGGGFVANAGATFTAASSTFNFTATTTGKSIIGIAPLTFWRMNFSGTNGGWVISQALSIGENFLPNAGTVSGTSNVSVSGTTVSGSGVVAMTGGTFTLANGGTFGGNTDWSFNNLTFGNGTAATTTKNGSSTVTVSGVLTDSANHTFQAGTGGTWVLSGAGTPLVLSGTFAVQNAIFRYASNGATNVTPATYARLDFGANGASSPVYTLGAGTFTIGSTFNVGIVATNTVTVSANTNDPAVTLSGDMNVAASSTFILSDTGSLTARRNWINLGTTTPSGGTVTFDATTTGFTINTGRSALANIVFNNASGGWTVAANATATGNLSLTALTSFTQSPNTTFEVDGVFTNGVGGSATTWTNATLYLNSNTTQTINTKTLGADAYSTLLIGGSTQVRMWNSSASTSTMSGTGSLYSMNHANVSGALNISGNYSHGSGTDYWDYATDFDGAALGTSSSRVVNVSIASSSTMTFSGGTLEVLGAAGATTTIDVQTSGAYAWNVTGGTLNMQYYKMRGTNQNGLSISGTPTVSSLSNGDFLLQQNGGTMMTVAGGTIDANPLKTFFGVSFATSSGITSGYNITATGVSGSVWTISGLSGNYAGEARDNDPGGDPGYIRWDDSASQITVSGNVYSDEGQTPIGPSACDGVSQTVVLKVQGAGTYSSACNAGTGAFSISNIIYNPQDTLTLFLSTSSAKAVNVMYDPATNIINAHLYQNRVILRHEQGTAIGIREMAKYDFNKNSAIPFTATTTVATSTSIFANTGLIVWNAKTFTPGGSVTLHANASANSWDGTVHLYASSTWSAANTEAYSVGGHFISDGGAVLSPANSTFTFTATTSGKSISASSTQTFYNLTFSGSGGAWDIGGVGTTSNDLTISSGAVTLPAATLAVGGSFNNSGGAFTANGGTVKFTATASGKNIRTGTSPFWNTLFSGVGGGWTYLDTNSTTSGTTTLTGGTLTLPSGVYAEGGSFDNQSGAFVANGGTLKMIATSSGQTIRLSGSSLANLLVAATGTFQFLDSNATTTGDVTLSFGTTTFPYATLAVGGSFTNTAALSAGTSTLVMNAGAAGKTISLGNSSLYNMTISGASGGFTISGNATTTNNFTLGSATTFTQSSGTTLAVGGVFTNSVGGAGTTWTGSILSLYGTSNNYFINTKSTGGDVYDTIRLAANTNIRMWGSSVSTTQLDPLSSIYSMNNGGTSGLLHIYGNYTKTGGADYWSYATDFDGTALGSPRQANVRFAANATATFANGATLQMLGSSAASTSVDRITSGNYGITLNSSYWNAQYYQFRNMNGTGLNMTGTTTISLMNNGDFSLDVNGGSSITIASTSVDQNASGQYFYVKFATSSGVTSGFNVTHSGTTANSITFNSEYGNYAGEAYDSDGGTDCGSIRWSDSACLISDQRAYRWRNDDGGEGAPASEWYNQSWTKRQRIRITNNATSTFADEQVKLTVPYDTDMKSDFTDLRFTDSGGTTSIPYWVEASTTSSSATVWVKVPTLPASGTSDIFMYFGNATGTSASDGISTFKFFDDFEDNNITEYSGNTTLFANDATFNYERSYGLAASAGNSGSQNTSGIAQASAGVGRDTTFRFFQYVDSTKSDEACFLFAVQSPITLHQNYAACLSPFGADKLRISKNAAYNGRNAADGATELATTNVTYSTGWYQVEVDWISTGNQINVNVYDSVGALFATATATDSTYISGGVGFTFWGQHGGWDIPQARAYNYLDPSYVFFTKQGDSGATWAAAENTYLPNYPQNTNIRLRFSVRNSSLAPLSENFRLQYAAKLAAPNCESVPTGNYVDVPTTSGGCSSDAACMTTSPQFANKASSTQLLSFPNGYTFTQSQILEDPSNQTDSISLLASAFTEIEYNFQMTNSSPLDRYCFRTTNAGVALDNYSRVAEIQVLHPPTISNFSFNQNANIALTEGTTTVVMATATVTDLNGYTDIVAASSTYYRSSIAGGRNCSADGNNCYQIATSSCSFSDCAGNSCTISCAAPVYYFADPTDVVANFAADVWNAILDVWDTANAHTNSTSNQELYTLKALTSSSTINYGSIVVGGDTGSSDATTTVNNTGNTVLNLLLSGSNMTAGSSTIPVDKQKYATTTFTYGACALCNILSSSSTPFNIGITKPTTTTLFSGNLYWGLAVPNGTAATTHSGLNTFFAN